MVLLITSTKKTKNDIIKIINPDEFLKLYVKKDTLKKSLSLQLTSGKIPQLRDSKLYNFSLSRKGKREKDKCLNQLKVLLFRHNKILTLMEG